MSHALDFDLRAFLPYRLNKAAERISLNFASEYKALYGLSRPEWRTLAALGSTDALTATEIGTHSSMHKTKVSRAVRSLEERRWLQRAQVEEDRRTELLKLTRQGMEAYAHLVVVAQAYERSLCAIIGNRSLRQLEAGLSAIEANTSIG